MPKPVSDIAIYERGRREGFNQAIDSALKIINAWAQLTSLTDDKIGGMKQLVEAQKYGQRKKKKLI